MSRAGVIVPLRDDLLGHQFRRAVHAQRRTGLVATQAQHPRDATVNRGVDHVLRPDDVGVNRLPRVALARLDPLHRSAVNHDADVRLARPTHAIRVPHIPDEEIQARIGKRLPHLRLLQFVAAEDVHPAGPDSPISSKAWTNEVPNDPDPPVTRSVSPRK